MLHLWLITGILGRKIPFISKLISLLSVWYGRNTWWKILGKLRKAFVILNAIIGVLVIFKTVGFSFDNMMIGFMAMGHAYFEVLGNITNKVFNWLLNLFDQKIVPNVPNTKPSNPKSVIDYISSPIEKIQRTGPVPKEIWNPLSYKTEAPTFSLRDIYMKASPSIDITPWYKDGTTWLWIVGIGCTIGIAYFGYKLYTDPLWFIFNTPTSPTVTPTTPTPPTNLPLPPSPDITVTDNVRSGIIGSAGVSIKKSFGFIKNKLNPFSYMLSSTELNNQFQTFMDYQNNPASADRRYYPFTEINPFLPWYKKIKVAVIGESTFDALQRLKDKTFADRIYESITISKGKYKMVEGLTPISSGTVTPILPGTVTPNAWGNIGVGVKSSFTSYSDIIHDLNIENKFNSITPTPKTIPAPISESILNDVTEWKTHEIDPKTVGDTSGFIKAWKTSKLSSTASGSSIKIEDLLAHNNKFDKLTEEII